MAHENALLRLLHQQIVLIIVHHEAIRVRVVLLVASPVHRMRSIDRLRARKLGLCMAVLDWRSTTVAVRDNETTLCSVGTTTVHLLEIASELLSILI